MTGSWIIAGSIKRLRDALGHRVFPSPSKIPYGGFSPVRLQTRRQRRPSAGIVPSYTTPQFARLSPMDPVSGGKIAGITSRTSRPEALGSPSGCVVRRGRCLLWPHPSHSAANRHVNRLQEWVPNLICVFVRACHPQHPGGSARCTRLLLPLPCGLRLIRRGSTSTVHARWFTRGSRNEAVSGSLALRPARLLTLHQQGLLLPSFRRLDHPRRRRLSLHGKQSPPMTGLAPAKHAAVWAAHEIHENWSHFSCVSWFF